MANKISVILDFVTDKANSSLKGFRASVDDADGAVGKFKAGAGAAFDQIKAHAGQLALAGGAALVAFGAKAVSAFTDTALSAGKLADSSGLAVEAASRWNEVGTSIGVSTESMAKGFNKLNMELGKQNPLLEQLGIVTMRNAQGQVDANATMLHAIDVIKAIQDPTKKAQVAQAAFGKGWMEMGELINMGSTQIKAGMDKVASGQVIDDKELAKARKMRDSIDNLKDAFGNLALEAGEALTPAIADVADALSTVAPLIGTTLQGVSKLTSAFDAVTEGAYDLGAAVGQLVTGTGYEVEELHDAERAARDHFAALSDGVTTMGQFIEALDRANIADTERALLIDEFIKKYPQESAAVKEHAAVVAMYTERVDGARAATEDLSDADDAAEVSTKDFTAAIQANADAMDRRIAGIESLVGGDIAVRNAQREAAAAVKELTEAQDEGKLSAEELAAMQDKTASSVIDAAEAAVTLRQKQLEANGETITATEHSALFRQKLIDLANTMAPGSELQTQIRSYIDMLNLIPSERTTIVRTVGAGSSGLSYNATGTPNWRGGLTVVGEQGPEIVDLPSGSRIYPNGQTPAGFHGGGFITPHSAVAAGWTGGNSAQPMGDTFSATVNNNGRDFGVADMSRALTLARLSR